MWHYFDWFKSLTSGRMDSIIEACGEEVHDFANFHVPPFPNPGAQAACFNLSIEIPSVINIDGMPWYKKKKNQPTMKPRLHRLTTSSGRTFLSYNCTSTASVTFKKYVAVDVDSKICYVVYISRSIITNFDPITAKKKKKISKEEVEKVREVLLEGNPSKSAHELLLKKNINVTITQVRNQTRETKHILKTWQPKTVPLQNVNASKAVQQGEHTFWVRKTSDSNSFVEVRLSSNDELVCTLRNCSRMLPKICDHLRAVISLLPVDRRENVKSILFRREIPESPSLNPSTSNSNHEETSSGEETLTPTPQSPVVPSSEMKKEDSQGDESRAERGHGRHFRLKFGFSDVADLSDRPHRVTPVIQKLTGVSANQEGPDDSDNDNDMLEPIRRLTSRKRKSKMFFDDIAYC